MALFVNRLIGEPWARDGRNCWRLVREAAAFFGYDLPLLFASAPAARGDKRDAYARHRAEPWASAWRETAEAPGGFAIAMMHRPFAPARDIEHCGAWLPMLDGGGVLHCDAPHGVVLDNLVELGFARRWAPVFYVPA